MLLSDYKYVICFGNWDIYMFFYWVGYKLLGDVKFEKVCLILILDIIYLLCVFDLYFEVMNLVIGFFLECGKKCGSFYNLNLFLLGEGFLFEFI